MSHRYKAVCISRSFNIARTWQTEERYEVIPRWQGSEYWLTVRGWHYETGKRTRTGWGYPSHPNDGQTERIGSRAVCGFLGFGKTRAANPAVVVDMPVCRTRRAGSWL